MARDQNLELEHDLTDEGGEGEGFDAERAKELVAFAVHSLARRFRLALGTFATVAGLGLAVATIMPSVYNSQVKLLAEKDPTLPPIINPHRAIPRDADMPASDLSEMILRRESVIALVKQADLVDRNDLTRPAVMRLKDRLTSWMHAPLAEDLKLHGLVALLEHRLLVWSDDKTVTISVDWPEPHMAYQLVTLVQRNFLEGHYDTRAAVIDDAISVLEGRAKSELDRVDAALADLAQVMEKESEADVRVVQTGPTEGQVVRRQTFVRRPPPSPTADPDLTRSLDETRQAIRQLEADHQRQLDDARQRLSEASLTFTSLHPTVRALQQKVEDLSKPPPELEKLKAKEHDLMLQIAPPASATVPAAPGAVAPAPAPAPAPAAAPAAGAAAPALVAATPVAPALNGAGAMGGVAGRPESGPTQLARSKLDDAIRGYQDVMGRIDAAKEELEIARLMFKHRYTVLTPAEVPTRPKKPIAALIGAGSVLGGGVLALLLAAMADLAGGRILEVWQIRRRLKLDVLGELDPPA